MRNSIIPAALFAVICGPAMAADMPVAPAESAVVVERDWSGFYAGVSAGYGQLNGDWTDVDGDWGELGGVFGSEPDGFVAGGQIGYNFQSGAFVYGLEADISYADLTESDRLFDEVDRDNGMIGLRRFAGALALPPARLSST